MAQRIGALSEDKKYSRNYLLPSLHHHNPLRDRVSRYTQSVVHGSKESTRNGLKYHNWTELSMREALGAVQQGMSVTKASVMYGIPRSTLNDHINGRVLPGAKLGAPTLLSSHEEEELVEFLCHCADVGYPKTRNEVLNITTGMLLQKGQDRTVTCGWWTKFICRHHEMLSLRTPATLSNARASASSKASINNYFDILEDTLSKSGLQDYPGLIYNMDESGFPLDPKPLKSVNPRGSKNPFNVSSGSKTQVSIAACVSAAGQSLPPYIIWKRKTMPPELAIGELIGTEYGLSDSGWMNSVLFTAWFRKIFLRYAPASRPILLLMDGHSSHYSPDTIKLAAENEVILFTLPPNTTHITQPLDKGVFGPFKAHWKLVCHDYQVSHPGQVINQYNFVQLFSKAWLDSMTASNITAGFKVSGIYPSNREAVHLPGETRVKKKVVPKVTYSPLKQYGSVDAMLTLDVHSESSPMLHLPQPPKALRSVASLPTPKLKTVPLYTVNDRISSSHPSLGQTKEGQNTRVAKGDKKSSKCALVQCVVCESSGVVTFKPCGHSVVCEMCAKAAKRCPNCKKPVKSFATQCLMCDDSTPGKVLPVKPCGHSFCRDCSKRMKRCFECKVPLEQTDSCDTPPSPPHTSFNLSTFEEPDNWNYFQDLNPEFEVTNDLFDSSPGGYESTEELVGQDGRSKHLPRKCDPTTKSEAAQVLFNSSPEDIKDLDTELELPHNKYDISQDVKFQERSTDSREYLAFLEWVHGLQLSMADREVLTSGGLLTANHVSAANKLLRKRFGAQNGLQDTHYLLVKKQWNSSPHDFVQIIFIGNSHWACLSNKFAPDADVELFDSAYTIPVQGGTILSQACCITKSLNSDRSNISINVIGVTPQVGAADCGLFAISMAYDLCCGIDPFTQEVIQDQMRAHLVNCFEKQEISSFPKVERKNLSSRQRVIKSVSFDIFCVCRGPEVKPMASCDICLEWYHPACVPILEDVFEYEDVEWICPSCERNPHLKKLHPSHARELVGQDSSKRLARRERKRAPTTESKAAKHSVPDSVEVESAGEVAVQNGSKRLVRRERKRAPTTESKAAKHSVPDSVEVESAGELAGEVQSYNKR